jgi:hypothetical protein
MQKQAIEDPGVFAGFSHTVDLPKLAGGRFRENYGYVALHRRMGIDRLYHACRQSDVFEMVSPYVCMAERKKNAEIYKNKTWEHMNVYKLKAELKSQPGTLSPVFP